MSAGDAVPVGLPGLRERVVPTNPVEAAWAALQCVYDPELCLDVVSLGLIYGISLNDNQMTIEMTLTTPGCPAAESLPEIAEAAVEEAVGREIEVAMRIVWEPAWSPEMMNASASAQLGFAPRR